MIAWLTRQNNCFSNDLAVLRASVNVGRAYLVPVWHTVFGHCLSCMYRQQAVLTSKWR